jgi:FHA domain
MIRLSIGRGDDNDIKLKDPNNTIGRVHLWVNVNDDGSIFLEHRGSETSSKTLVNGREILSAMFKESDSIQLGNVQYQGQDFIKPIRDFVNRDRTDFSEEFQQLVPDFKAYEKQVAMMDKNVVPTLMKALPSVAMAAASFMKELEPYRPYMLGGASLLMVLGVLMPANNKRKEKKELLDLEYSTKLKCPKCGTPLLNKTLAFWTTRKQCQVSSCKALFLR